MESRSFPLTRTSLILIEFNRIKQKRTETDVFFTGPTLKNTGGHHQSGGRERGSLPLCAALVTGTIELVKPTKRSTARNEPALPPAGGDMSAREMIFSHFLLQFHQLKPQLNSSFLEI